MASNPTDQITANAPFWDTTTTTAATVLTGGFDAVTVAGYYVIVSNVGANNAYIGSSNATPGILVQPGGSFETAIRAGAPLFITGTAGQAVTVVQFVA